MHTHVHMSCTCICVDDTKFLRKLLCRAECARTVKEKTTIGASRQQNNQSFRRALGSCNGDDVRPKELAE